jgi:hypothetical protein
MGHHGFEPRFEFLAGLQARRMQNKLDGDASMTCNVLAYTARGLQ